MNPNLNICDLTSISKNELNGLESSQTSIVDSETFDASKSCGESDIKHESNRNITHHITFNIDDSKQNMKHNTITDNCSENAETNSWDTLSQLSLSIVSGKKEEIASCWDSIEALPPELPLLCNIAQQVNDIESGTLEMMIVDVDDTNSWDSDPSLKDKGLITVLSEELPSGIQNSNLKISTVVSQSPLEGKCDNNTEVAAITSENEGAVEMGVKTFDDMETVLCCENEVTRKKENEEKLCLKETNCNILNNSLQLSQEDIVIECGKTVLYNEQEDKREILQHLPNVWKSKSFHTGTQSPFDFDFLKFCKQNIFSTDSVNQMNVNKEQQNICNTIDDCMGEMGDSASGKIKCEDAAKILKQYMQPVEPLILPPQGKTNEETCYRNQVYECHILSVNHLPDDSNSEAQQVTPNMMMVPVVTENEEEQAEIVAQEVPPEHQAMALPLDNEANEAIGPKQILSTPPKVKHRPIKQPDVHVQKHWPACTQQSSEAWVLVDSQGNTQEVTPRDVNILLGGRSADSVVAKSTAHPMPRYAVERDTRSETGAVPRLAPLIRESLLLLQQDDIGDEQPHPRRLSLERKAGNMLLYIGMDMNLVPSVRFIDVETEMVDLWRHSQNFNRECEPAGSPKDSANTQLVFLSLHEVQPDNTLPLLERKGVLQNPTPVNSSKVSDVTDQPNTEIRHRLEEIVTRYKELAQARDKLYIEEKERAAQLQAELANLKEKYNAHQQELDGDSIRRLSRDRSIIPGIIATQQSSLNQQHILNEVRNGLLNFRNFLRQSEEAVKQAIAKYISDKKFEQQLLNAVKSYNCLQVKAEQRANILAQDLIDEQARTLKNNQDSSEASIVSHIKQIRALEEENKNVLKKIEKLQLRLKQHLSDAESSQVLNKEGACIRNNEKLRSKLAAAQSIIEEAEDRQLQMQATIDWLTDHVRNSKLEIDNQKLTNCRLNSDHQMEIALLKKELNSKDKILQDSVEVADVLVDDMEGLKKLFKETGQKVHINWERLKAQGSGLTNLIHVCRGCVNELGRELLNVRNQLKLEQKDMSVLKDANEQLKTVLKEMDEEVNLLRMKCDQSDAKMNEALRNLQNQIAENVKLQEHVITYSQNTDLLKNEVQNLRGINDSNKQKKDVLAELEQQLRSLSAENQALQEKCLQNDKNIWDKKKLSNSLDAYDAKCKELVKINTDLHSKVDQLHKSVLDAQIYPEKLSEMEKKYYKEVADNSYLNEQLDVLKMEQAVLAESKNKLLEHVQKLEAELSEYTQENADLKMELTNLNAMLKCFEYDNYNKTQQLVALKNIAEDKKSESVIEELQAALDQMVHDKQELIKMVKCNNQMTDCAQKCCEEKNAAIHNLGTRYNELLAQHVQAKQEVAILQQQGLQLENNIAVIQTESNKTIEAIRKNLELMDATLRSTNKELQVTKYKLKEKENQVEKQQETIDEIQNVLMEDMALRDQFTKMQDVMIDYENVVDQRDKLAESQKEFLTEIENLHQNLNKKQKKFDSLTRVCSQQALQLKEMDVKLKGVQNNLEKNTRDAAIARNLENEFNAASVKIVQYENHILALKEEVVRLQQALKHESMKAQSENQDRNPKEKDAENELKVSKEIMRRKVAENEMLTAAKNEKELKKEIEDLKQQLKQAVGGCNKMTKVICHCQEEMLKRESEYTKTIHKQNEAIKEKMKETSLLSQKNTQMKKDFENLQSSIQSLDDLKKKMEQQLMSHGRTLHELEQVKRTNKGFESQVHMLLLENNSTRNLGAFLEKQNSEVSLSLQATRKELDETKLALRTLETLDNEKTNKLNILEDLKVKHSSERLQLLRELQEMESDKNDVEHSALEISKVKRLLEKEQQDLSEKLLQAVRMLLEEKLRHHKAESRLHEMEAFIMHLEQEKVIKQDHVKSLSTEIDCLKDQLYEISHDNLLIHERIKSFEKSNLNLQQESINVQHMIQDLQKKLLFIKSKNQCDKEKLGDLILVKEAIIMKNKEHINSFEEKVQRLMKNLKEIQEKLVNQHKEQSKMHEDIVKLQSEKNNLDLRLQEVEGHLEEEIQLRKQLEKTSLTLLDEISKLRFDNLTTTKNEQILDQITSSTHVEISSSESTNSKNTTS